MMDPQHNFSEMLGEMSKSLIPLQLWDGVMDLWPPPMEGSKGKYTFSF